jgi:restriction system protein
MLMQRRHNLSQWLALAPWWISVIISAGTFVCLQYLLPPLLDNTHAEASGAILQFWSPYIAILLVIPLPFALFNREERERLVETERNLNLLRELKHSAFVNRLIPVFRQQGYGVEEVSDAHYDLILRRGGEKTIVTCKTGHAGTVSTRFVRNVQQTQTAQHAAGAKVITCGSFSPGAARYQRTSSVELIDGHKLIRLMDEARKAREEPDDLLLPFSPSSGNTLPLGLVTDSDVPACPRCGSGMNLQSLIAEQGDVRYWVCARYPACRSTRPT